MKDIKSFITEQEENSVPKGAEKNVKDYAALKKKVHGKNINDVKSVIKELGKNVKGGSTPKSGQLAYGSVIATFKVDKDGKVELSQTYNAF